MARHSGGWVCLHRRIFDHELFFGKGNNVAIFSYLLARANHSPSKFRGVTIDRGEFFGSTREIAEALGYHQSAISRALMKFESASILKRKPHHNGTIITILNYRKYQDINFETETPTDNDLHRKCIASVNNNEQVTTIEPCNKFLGAKPQAPKAANRDSKVKDRAPGIAGRIIKTAKKFGPDLEAVKQHIEPWVLKILMERWVDWNDFCREMQLAYKDGKESFFVDQLTKSLTANILLAIDQRDAECLNAI